MCEMHTSVLDVGNDTTFVTNNKDKGKGTTYLQGLGTSRSSEREVNCYVFFHILCLLTSFIYISNK